jgi:hypothetical protein
MSHTTSIRAAALLLLAAFALVAPGGAAAADASLPWTVRAAANDFGANRPAYRYTIDPGGKLEDGLVVVNHGAAPLRLAVYAADGFTTDTGRLGLDSEGAASTTVGAWVRPGRDEVTVRAGEAVEVPFAIAVPRHAAPGDYMGGLVTSASAGAADETGGERVSIPIRLRVGGPLEPSLAVESVHVGYSHPAGPFSKGDATVTYTIHNTGNAILTARQKVSVSGLFGRWAAAARVPDSPALLPDETWDVSVPVHDVVPALRLAATVTLVPLLTDAAGSTAPLAATEGSGHAWAVPWALLAAVALVGGLAAAGVVVALRRRRAA